MFIDRALNLPILLAKKSHFLFGARGTGKTKLIEHSFSQGSILSLDLLNDDIYSRLLRRPALIDELVGSASLVVVDEIQRLPNLLNEVHRMIESKNIRFLLTGSSARKLKKGGANLLGGRAWESKLFPLTSFELKEHFQLERYLSQGGLPAIYFSQYPQDELKNYLSLYLKEEIAGEALVRKIDHFARFLDTAGLSSSKEINYEQIGSDAGVPPRTVASYFEILEDTLIGFQVRPYSKTKKRKAVSRSKFYMFDVGVAGAMAKRGPVVEGSEAFGDAFEHFIAQELRAYLSYNGSDLQLMYWRTTSQHEVDFIVGDHCAIEVKSTERVSERHLSGLKALMEEGKVKKYLLVSREPLKRTEKNIEILPWKDFLRELWEGRLF
jgi:predicted AAA+ superfamily ATPase